MNECNQCGKCCTNYSNGGLSASTSEIEYWEIHRPDIFEYVHDGNIWMDPDSGRQIELCPWLRRQPQQNRSTCAIYLYRPDDCRIYPARIEDMVKDECEMLEQRDLADRRQAQKSLELFRNK